MSGKYSVLIFSNQNMLKSIYNFPVLILFALLFVIGCSTPETNPSDSANDKKTIQYQEEYAQVPPFDTLWLSAKTTFNEAGKPLKKVQYSKINHSMILQTSWAYDTHFNEVSKTVSNIETNQNAQESFLYKYDKKGKKIYKLEKKESSVDIVEHFYFYHNDDSYTDTTKLNSEVVAIIKYNPEDKILNGENFQQRSTIINTMDEHGNYTSRKTTYADGPANEASYTNTYDDHGNLIRKSIDADNFRTFEYNENGDVIKENRYNETGNYLRFTYKIEYFE